MEGLQHMACSAPLGVSAGLTVCVQVLFTLEVQSFDWKKNGGRKKLARVHTIHLVFGAQIQMTDPLFLL